jgi:hypothetical protein
LSLPFSITSRQALVTVDGFTQASSVIAVVRRSEAESGIVTRELVPLKLSAPPYLPATAQVVFATVPPLPLPDASTTAVPEPSSNANAATSSGDADLAVGVTTTPAMNAETTSERASRLVNDGSTTVAALCC